MKIRVFQYRNKCIGCNACVEIAYNRWRMSKKDGKSVLLGATEKKGIYQTLIPEDELEENQKAAEACPVNIIQVQVY
jgi:ferredoxin